MKQTLAQLSCRTLIIMITLEATIQKLHKCWLNSEQLAAQSVRQAVLPGLCWPIGKKLEGHFPFMTFGMLVSGVPAVNRLQNEQFCLQREVKLALLIVGLKQSLQLLLEMLPCMAIHVYSDVWQCL